MATDAHDKQVAVELGGVEIEESEPQFSHSHCVPSESLPLCSKLLNISRSIEPGVPSSHQVRGLLHPRREHLLQHGHHGRRDLLQVVDHHQDVAIGRYTALAGVSY